MDCSHSTALRQILVKLCIERVCISEGLPLGQGLIQIKWCLFITINASLQAYIYETLYKR